ncbi:MAG: hypothetical protein LQ350_007902 [Teloschistes chrysophthalmus]|nr:MAG: hypothetical protein LQ350_007902 [Niorma chrysophthalma]
MARQFFVGGNFKMLSSLEVVIAPPGLYLLLAREHLRQGIEVAAQNVFNKPNGAFTGEISAEQLKDSGITWALTGHSERRVIIGEENDFIASKTEAALAGGLGVILCIGETLEVASTEQAQEVHAEIRKWLSSTVSKDASENTRIIYGGSVSEKNCRDLAKQADIDGFLVGGASLKPAFVDIINARA